MNSGKAYQVDKELNDDNSSTCDSDQENDTNESFFRNHQKKKKYIHQNMMIENRIADFLIIVQQKKSMH